MWDTYILYEIEKKERNLRNKSEKKKQRVFIVRCIFQVSIVCCQSLSHTQNIQIRILYGLRICYVSSSYTAQMQKKSTQQIISKHGAFILFITYKFVCFGSCYICISIWQKVGNSIEGLHRVLYHHTNCYTVKEVLLVCMLYQWLISPIQQQ